MKFGLWFLSAGGIGVVSTLLAAALPVPPSLPSLQTEMAPPTQVAAAPAPAPSTSALPATAPAPAPIQLALPPPPPPAIARPEPVAAQPAAPTVAPTRLAAGHVARRPIRRLAKRTPVHHRRAVAHAVRPRYAIVRRAPAPYPGMPVSGPTHIAMGPPPPPYGMPAPYWARPYPPYPPN